MYVVLVKMDHKGAGEEQKINKVYFFFKQKDE